MPRYTTNYSARECVFQEEKNMTGRILTKIFQI